MNLNLLFKINKLLLSAIMFIIINLSTQTWVFSVTSDYATKNLPANYIKPSYEINAGDLLVATANVARICPSSPALLLAPGCI